MLALRNQHSSGCSLNIFVVDGNPKKAAQALCDAHVVKMPTECTQIVCTAYELEKRRLRMILVRRALMHDPETRKEALSTLKILDQAVPAPMKPVHPLHHKQHPIIRWAMSSHVGMYWLMQHADGLFKEFKDRFGYVHGAAIKFTAARHIIRQSRISHIGRDLGTPFTSFVIPGCTNGLCWYQSALDSLSCVQCMPQEYKSGPAVESLEGDLLTYSLSDTVTAYRNYYIKKKVEFARWTRNRPPPDWWPYSTSRPPHGTLLTCSDLTHEASPFASR
jgi:hypothetical protein